MYNRILAIEDDYDERSETDRIRTLNTVLQDRKVKKMMATQLRRRFRTADQWIKRAEYYKNIVRNLKPDYNKKDKDLILKKKDSFYLNRSKKRQKKENYRKDNCNKLYSILKLSFRAQIFPIKLSATKSLASYKPLYCKSLPSIFFSLQIILLIYINAYKLLPKLF